MSSPPAPRRRWRRRDVIAAGAVLALTGCGSATASLPGTGGDTATGSTTDSDTGDGAATTPAAPTGLQLVVSPHPDDEMEAWSQVDRSPALFTLWLTMTRGEATAHCAPDVHAAELDVAAGEIPPSPTPQGPGTPSCEDARTATWVTFLTHAWPAPGDLDPSDGPDPALPGRSTAPTPQRLDLPAQPAADGLGALPAATRDGRPSPGALVWTGAGGAMVALDAGDGEVTPDDVAWGVRAVLAQRGAALPDLPLARIVSAAYVGELPDAPYQHPDHRAVQEALLDPGLTRALAPADGTFVVTGAHDPRANLTSEVDEDEYRRLMGLGPAVTGDDGEPTPRRRGLAQRVYGWLAFPGGSWPPTERALPDAAGDPLIMARVQSFVHLPGPGA